MSTFIHYDMAKIYGHLTLIILELFILRHFWIVFFYLFGWLSLSIKWMVLVELKIEWQIVQRWLQWQQQLMCWSDAWRQRLLSSYFRQWSCNFPSRRHWFLQRCRSCTTRHCRWLGSIPCDRRMSYNKTIDSRPCTSNSYLAFACVSVRTPGRASSGLLSDNFHLRNIPP